MLEQLAGGPDEHVGKRHVAQLLDRFELKGPNGRHQCLVTEPLGASLAPCDLTPKTAWHVAKQLVEATAYMHSNGVAHGGAYFCESPVPL